AGGRGTALHTIPGSVPGPRGFAKGRPGADRGCASARQSSGRREAGGGMQKGRGIREQCAGRRGRSVCLGVAVATLLMPRAASAVVGHYVAGVANTHDFFVPPTEGLFFAMYTYVYHTDSFRDRNGNPVDHLSVPPRFRPPSTLPLDVELTEVAL